MKKLIITSIGKFAWLLVTFLWLYTANINAQISISGSINPVGRFRISDVSDEISLPFRIAKVDWVYAYDDFEFKVNTALEYRWSDTEDTDIQLREAYLIWYPAFGEVKIGKQIFAWGTADGNNPTDNLSTYDFYYMFSPDIERKQGSLSAAVNLYYGDWQIMALVSPKHQENRLPFNEPDFPVIPFPEPEDEQLEEIKNPLEFGFRLQTIRGESDVSLSYFKAHDRMFSPYDIQIVPTPDGNIPVSQAFGYRSTHVFGSDLVTFIRDITLRGEVAFFITETPENVNTAHSAKYTQYVLQAEYKTRNDITLMGQFIGQTIHNVEDLNDTTPTFITKDNFQSGMGTPFAILADRVLIFSATGDFMDNRLELKGSGLINLEEQGQMFGCRFTYSPKEAWEIEFSIAKFLGKEGDENNRFTQLEDFSHYTLGLKYSF